MITHNLNAEAAERMLNSDEPHRLECPNHHSSSTYPEFVTESIAAVFQSGRARELEPGHIPLCTHPLGVADNKAPKLRLIIDPAYINVLFRYRPLRYEQLADLAAHAKPNDWATTTDEKSGYYHILLHPSLRNLLAFSMRAVITHMAFGIGPACRTYTILKQELFRVIKDKGNVRMAFLIDDQCNMAQSKDWASLRAAAILTIQWAVGFTLSLPKCQLSPTRTPHILGMIVDLTKRAFFLPEPKIRDFQQRVADICA